MGFDGGRSRDRRSVLRSGAASGASVCLGWIAGCLGSIVGEVDDSSAEFSLETVTEGLAHPWGIAFLPDRTGTLVTERDGRLSVLEPEDGSPTVVGGTPEVHVTGQGGMLDVAIHPEYSDEPWIYLTYAAANTAGETTTHLGRGRLEPGETDLTDYEAIFVAEPFVDANGHYGSRVVFGPDENLYLTVGDRQFSEFGPGHVSQDRSNHLGTTLRLEPDGAIPEDNPFVDERDLAGAIYSYGHRNAQGMTVHPETGALWQSEHGERDGDELNVIQAGGNYGWPIAHYGCEYETDEPIGVSPHERDDVVDPVYHWECQSGGFPPAGMTFYDGDAFPAWQEDLFVGTLAGRYLGRFAVENEDGSDDGDVGSGNSVTVTEADPLLADRGWRIRDVEVEPETGHLYVAVDAEDAPLVRLVPTS